MAVEAKHKKDIQHAPFPAAILQAKTAFLANGGGGDLADDTFYQAMKQWGRYQITDSPDKAELIFEVSYGVVILPNERLERHQHSHGTNPGLQRPRSIPANSSLRL